MARKANGLVKVFVPRAFHQSKGLYVARVINSHVCFGCALIKRERGGIGWRPSMEQGASNGLVHRLKIWATNCLRSIAFRYGDEPKEVRAPFVSDGNR